MHIDPAAFPLLTTERLVLRRLDTTDSDALLRLRSDERVNKYLNREPAKTKADADAFIEKIHQLTPDKGFYWAISLNNDPELVGTICYWNMNMEKNNAETGFELLPDYHGRGLMQEALSAVLRYAFDELKLKTVTALVHPANESSIKLLKRAGFMPDTAHQYVTEEEAEGPVIYVRKA